MTRISRGIIYRLQKLCLGVKSLKVIYIPKNSFAAQFPQVPSGRKLRPAAQTRQPVVVPSKQDKQD